MFLLINQMKLGAVEPCLRHFGSGRRGTDYLDDIARDTLDNEN